jgi:para-nitrobenzyl esterase
MTNAWARRVALAVASFAALAALAAAAKASPSVRISGGLIEGTSEGLVDVYRGVPFAAPPIQALRWRAPQAVSSWPGVRDAKRFSPSCPQALATPTQLAPILSTAEDCLYLNVWKPKKGRKKHPVMVWLHGGGFIAGSGAEQEFDGAEFAKRGVVLVTTNYRIGRLGFFAHPAIDHEHPEEPHGNFGLLDQVAALRWVQRNISSFGGDPNNVTVFGESAGAISIVYLSVAPMAKGLFKREIIQSGGVRRPVPDLAVDHEGTPAAETSGNAWARALGVAADDPAAATKLRALPVEIVAPASPALPEVMAILKASQPMIDGRLLPSDPNAAFDHAGVVRTPMILGSNGRESQVWMFGNTLGTLSLTPPVLPGILKNLTDAQQASFLGAYRATGLASDSQIEAAAASDVLMGAGTVAIATVAARDVPVYLYRFDAVPGPGRETIDAAPHGTEIFYVFGTLRAFPFRSDLVTQSDRALSMRIMDYWVAFARTGIPDAKNRPSWPRFDPQRNELLLFANEGVISSTVPRLAAIQLLSRGTLR